MTAYPLLGLAIAFEVVATLSLKVASGFTRPAMAALVLAGYALSYVCLGLALNRGLNLSVGYAIWSTVGIMSIALISRVVYDERLSATSLMGLLLITAGCVLAHVGSTGGERTGDPEAASRTNERLTAGTSDRRLMGLRNRRT